MKYIKHIHTLRSCFLVGVLLMTAACSTVPAGPIRTFEPEDVKDPEQISRIYLPPEIEILAFDGSPVETPYVAEGFNELQLLPGKHKIAVFYKKLWGDPASGYIVKSEAAILELKVTKQQDYYLKFEEPENMAEAEALKSNFRPWIETAGQKRVAKTKRTVDTSFMAYVSGSSNAAIATGGGVMNLTRPDDMSSGNATLSAEEIVARQNPVERLKFWWKLADKQDKLAFQKWVKAEP